MKVLVLTGLLAAGLIQAESAIVIPSDARIYVDARSGFDVYLAAALTKRHVPLTVTTDKSKADYAIEEVSEHDQKAASDQSGVWLVDLRNGDVLFAWPAERTSTLHSRQTAEALAKKLAAGVHTSEKHRFSGSSKNPSFDF